MRRIILSLTLTFCTTLGVAQTIVATPDLNAWRDQTLAHLKKLVMLDTSNPPGNEIIAAKYIQGVLKAEGIESEIFESAPTRATIVARIKGNGKKKPLLLLGHLDVVGVEYDKWSEKPFEAIEQDGFLYGRGTWDDKAMVAANLAVFLQLKHSNFPLDRDVIFMAEAGEEGTSQFGIDFMVEKHWDKIACEYSLNEGGETEIQPDGKLPFVSIQTTEKVPRGLLVKATGSSGHASMPRLDNAVTHLAAAVGKIGNWQPPLRLNDTTRAFFAKIATVLPPDEAKLYAHVEDPAVQEKLRATNILYNSMLRTSIVPTIIKGGFRENVIPGDAEATLDVRALPDEDIDKLVETLGKLVNDPAIKITRRLEGQTRPTSTPSRFDTEMFKALEHATQKIYPGSITVPTMSTGATDSAQLRAKGVQAYGISVAGTANDRSRMHGNNERVLVESLGRFAQFIYSATMEVAGAK
jgi:acetylornithine deacetylase/succinyl-diaminopimelate desuccinylase-like protein